MPAKDKTQGTGAIALSRHRLGRCGGRQVELNQRRPRGQLPEQRIARVAGVYDYAHRPGDKGLEQRVARHHFVVVRDRFLAAIDQRPHFVAILPTHLVLP